MFSLKILICCSFYSWTEFLAKSFLMFIQVFLDVVESVNILVNSNGQIIRSDVVGALKMRTYLRCFFYPRCIFGSFIPSA